MADCNGCKNMEKHVDILKEILLVRENIEKESTTTRVSMLMRMIGNETKTDSKEKRQALRKELIQAAAACVMHLESL